MLSELVSVIIPCYNQGNYVMDAINSVQFQTYKNWEIIIINDGSNDEFTYDLLSNLKIKDVKVFHTTNQGLPTARNIGIARASGKYILPLDADDKIDPTYIDKALSKFKSDPTLKLVYSRGRYFGASVESMPYHEKEFKLQDLLLYNFIFCSAIFKKVDFEYAGGYSVNMKGGWEDWDLWIRLLKDGRGVFQIPEELFFYRVKEISMIESLKKDENLQNILGQNLFNNNRAIYYSSFGSPLLIYRQWEKLKQEVDNIDHIKYSIYSTASYRLGHFLLSPFKWVYKIGFSK